MKIIFIFSLPFLYVFVFYLIFFSRWTPLPWCE